MSENNNNKLLNVAIEISGQFFLAVVVGLIMAVVANAFVEGARWFADLAADKSLLQVSVGGTAISLDLLVTLSAAAALILIVRRVLGITAWSGPAESIYAVQQSREPLDVRLGLGSTMAAFISASGGASVGQYGPLVHFGATLTQVLLSYVRVNLDRNVFIACGVAGAISAGFNAPIAGVLFAHEALLRRFSIGAITPIAISAIVAYTVNQSFFANELLLSVPEMPVTLSELFPALVLAAPICSLAAIAYMMVLRETKSLFGRLNLSLPALMFGCILVITAVGTVLPEVMGLGTAEINRMIDGEFALSLLCLVLVAKIVVTSLCINSGFFGGVFGPALFVGAAVGGIAAHLAMTLGLDASQSHALAVAAMAAVGASVIGAPLTVIVIVIELTGSYGYGLSALLCVILTSALTLRFFGLSYFDRQLLDRGIDLRLGPEHIEMSLTKLHELTGSNWLRLDLNMTPAQAEAMLHEVQASEAYVCDVNGKLLGKVDVHSLTRHENMAQAMDRQPIALNLSDSLIDAMHTASVFVGESIPVLDHGKIVTTLTEGDIFNAVLEVQQSLRSQ